MILVVAASNYFVQFPINAWLTLGALTYPISFLITEITNQLHGPAKAKKIVYIGFVVAVFLSLWLASPRIAFASGTAFLFSQLLDIFVFNKLRQQTWWYAPFFSSFAASLLDTVIFWTIAFYGEDLPLFTLALGDFGVKVFLDLLMLTPFRLAIRNGTLRSAP